MTTQPRSVNAFTHPDAVCLCVTDHRPTVITFPKHHIWPLGMGGPNTPENIVLVCGTTHYSIHHLLRAWVVAGGQPDWAVRRRFGPYARMLAEDGYQRWIDAGRPEAATAVAAAGWLA